MLSVSVHKDGELIATAVGDADVTDFCGMAAMIAEIAGRTNRHCALVDLLAVRPTMTTQQHVEIGTEIARILAGLQVALVVPHVERIMLGERAAQGHGLHLRTFTTLAEAETWLAETKCS